MTKIFKEENDIYQIDLSKSIWAIGDLNTIFHKAKISRSDVDFIAETETEFLFIEYKNSIITTEIKPEAFNPLGDKKINQVVKKYYDSLTYINYKRKNYQKLRKYIYILENVNGDEVLRRKVRARIKTLLPFSLQEQENFDTNLIDEVQVLSIDEWNEKFPEFPLTKIK